MPSFKFCYLIHGDDHGRISERRASLRRIAEEMSGVGGVEIFEGEDSHPDKVAIALNSLTFAIGRRFLIVDGVERWKERELELLLAAMSTVQEETTVAFFSRDSGRMKPPGALIKAVEAVGGDIAVEKLLKPWELPRWLVREAAARGLRLENDAAELIVQRVGERQQRLLRELEKLAVALHPATELTVEEVHLFVSGTAQKPIWNLADSWARGDSKVALRQYLELIGQGETTGSLIYGVIRRLRTALDVAVRADRGEPRSELLRSLRMPPRAAQQLVADATSIGTLALRKAVIDLAKLEIALRGGSSNRWGELLAESDQTSTVRTISRLTDR